MPAIYRRYKLKLSYFNLLFFNDEGEIPEVVEENTTEEVQAQPEWLNEIVGKYDKEDFSPSTKEELVELIEMGRFYKEKGKSSLDSYKNEQSKIDFINAELEKQGFNDFNEWKSAIDVARQDEAIARLATEKGYSLEDARTVHEGQTAKEQINAMTAKENESKAQEKARETEISNFFKEHPDMKTEDLAKEVLDAFDKGVNLNTAYYKHEAEAMKQQLQQIEKIKSNGDVSPGSLSGMQSKEKMDIQALSKDEFKEYVKAKLASGK